MDENSPSPRDRFFCLQNGKSEGPFDLIELAGQIKVSQIGSETLVCRAGANDWKPLRELPEYASVQQITIEVIARHLEMKKRAGDSAPSVKKASSAPWETVAIIFVVLIIAGVAFVFVRGPAAARTPAPPDATFTFPQQYSAETSSALPSGKVITGRIYKDGGKVRTELDTYDGNGIFINRPDLGKVYQLHASTKTITQKPLQVGIADLGVTGPNIRFEALQPVDDHGVACEMYMYTQGDKRSTVMIRLDNHAPIWLVTSNGKLSISIQYDSYKAGPPPASVFELPPDYRIISN